jgi:hypothetical protein
MRLPKIGVRPPFAQFIAAPPIFVTLRIHLLAPPELLLDIEALHPWQRLMELIDHCEPRRPRDATGGLGFGQVWEGTVQDLEDVCRERAPSRAQSVLRGPQGTGMDLHCAMQRLPHRIAKRQSMGRTIWIIRRGATA